MKESLIELIHSKRKSKDEKLTSQINDLKKYSLAFFNKNILKKGFDVCKIDDKDIVSAFFVASNPLKSMEILSLINKYKALFDINSILPLLIYYFDEDQDLFCRRLGKCLKIENNFLRLVGLSIVFSKYDIPHEDIKAFNEFLKLNPCAFKELSNVIGNYSLDDGYKCVEFIWGKSIFIEFYEKEIVGDSHLNSQQRRFKKKKIFSKNDSANPLNNVADDYYEYLHIKYNSVISEYEQKERERQRYNKNIMNLVKCLDNTQEISNIDEILKLSPDEECTRLLVDYVISHNKEVYSKLVSDYEKMIENSDENLQLLFSKYGFSYDRLESTELIKLKKISYESIQSLLFKLSSLGLNNINPTSVCLYKLDAISNLITKGIITKEWLRANSEIILADNGDFNLVISNLGFLTKDGVNMILYNNSLDILKSLMLEYNLNLLKSYNILINKNTTDIRFLSDINLREKIEFIISALLYQLGGSLDVLNYSLEYCYKLKISNILNVSVTLVDIEDSLLCDYSESLIPAFIQERLNGEMEVEVVYPKLLDEYVVDKNTLDINGVIVSIEKVRRNLAKIGNSDNLSVFYAIIYKGYYSYEEIEILNETILGKDYSNNCYLFRRQKSTN